MKRVILLIAMLVSLVLKTWAQVDDVTLVVSGEGATKDVATNMALRSAIEQAFGVFVSANTEILNDELIKDEIATVSSGNIKSFTELGAITKTNGNTIVSLQATVSVKKLTSYAQSHGSSAEFAGAVFAANLKMTQLNRENTKMAFDNLVKQIDAFGSDDLYDCQIEVGNPKVNGEIDVALNYYSTEKLSQVTDLIMSTLGALSLSSGERENFKSQGERYYEYLVYHYTWGDNESDYCVDMKNVYSEYLRHNGKNVYRIAFLEPLPDMTVRGNFFAIYDNQNNIYPLKVNNNDYQYHGQNGNHGNDDFSRYDLKIKNLNKNSEGISFIRIPKSYLGKWKNEKKGKEKMKVFQSSLVCKITGKINVPSERFKEISGFTVKQQSLITMTEYLKRMYESKPFNGWGLVHDNDHLYVVLPVIIIPDAYNHDENEMMHKAYYNAFECIREIPGDKIKTYISAEDNYGEADAEIQNKIINNKYYFSSPKRLLTSFNISSDNISCRVYMFINEVHF